MTDRRTALLDAALALVGEQGIRALTHRAVDGAAGLPAGSASNHFRTRDALVAGLVERFAERERALVPAAPERPTRDDVVAVLAAYATRAVGEGRAVSLARYAILVEAAQRPSLRPALDASAEDVNAWARDLLARAGSPDPERDQRVLGNHLTGVVLHQLSRPDPDFDPQPLLATLVETLWRTP